MMFLGESPEEALKKAEAYLDGKEEHHGLLKATDQMR